MTFFYNLNKTLDAIREKPETTHGQLNERDMGKHNNAVTGFKAVADKAAKEYGSKAAGERVAGAVKAKMAKAGKLEEADLEEGFVDTVKSGAQAALSAIGSTLGHGSDEDMIRDLQKKAGLPQTGKVPPQQPGQPAQTGQQPTAEGVDKEAFAALAEPKDKITFADKIAGAKKEVDEMLGDVAAEAMKNALSGHSTKSLKAASSKDAAADRKSGVSPQYSTQQIKGELKRRGEQVADEGNAFTGKLKSTPKGGKFKMGNKEYTDSSDVDEGFPTVAGARAELNKRKVGDVTHGAKHDTEETPTGRRVTRRTDPNTGYSVGSDTDDEGNAKSTEKKGRGRPKKTDKQPERVTAKAYKHKGGRKEKVEEESGEGNDLVKLSKVIASCKTKEQLAAAQQMANNFLKKHRAGGFSNMGKDMSRLRDVEGTLKQKNAELDGVKERKLSSSEKEEREDIVKGMKKNKAGFEKDYGKDAKSVMYATATKMAKERGPGNPDRKKKEKTDETTVSGSVAPAAGGKAKGGIVGKGIYDSLNRDLEAMISESMNVSVNMSMDEHGEPRKSITINADGEAAEQLAQLLNLAGMQAQEMNNDKGCGCDTDPCSCEELDENQPDWPTNKETTGEDDPEMRLWSGGLNGPKSTGQTTGAPFNRQPQRQGVMGENRDLGMKLYAELKSFKG